ncbi:MAG: hypothetical protein EP344_19000 [Bacteroidetes bacterium]|nr:MAG: hypothetical protein EP344_19000 [Bacteroidota bacterium]
MVIIADCGSTKCDWLLIGGNRDHRLENTSGFNPFIQSTADVVTILKQQLVPNLKGETADRIWFYGTGIHDDYRAGIVGEALAEVFPGAVTEVEHDLLAAARATCKHRAGISCILGTGSNSCYYDGTAIRDNVISLGWLLGDEGSGTHLGKALLRAWFYRELPEDLKAAFEQAYPEGKDYIKDQVYEKGLNANAYIATFTRFLGDHMAHPYTRQLIADSLGDFLDRHVCKYQGHQQVPVHFVGSIAHHFEEILLECMEDRHLRPGVILRKPIHALAEFHLGSMD